MYRFNSFGTVSNLLFKPIDFQNSFCIITKFFLNPNNLLYSSLFGLSLVIIVKSWDPPSWKKIKAGSILLQEIISPGSDKALTATSSCLFSS